MGQAESQLAAIVEAKRAEIEALGIDFSAFEPRKLADLPLCERDYGERTSPHGDPLAALFAAVLGPRPSAPRSLAKTNVGPEAP